MAGSTRRAAILDSALAEFAAHGYHGARIERIAAAAGANKQLIFHYFGSKDGLYEAAIARWFAEPPTRSDRSTSPVDRLKGIVGDIETWLYENPGAALALAECSPGDDVPAAAAELAAGWIHRHAEALRAAVDDGQRQGFFRDDVDAQAVANMSFASLVGTAVVARSRATAELPRRPSGDIGRMVADLCAWR